MTPEQPFHCQPETFYGTILGDGFPGIFAARRREAAGRAQEGRDGHLIESDQQQEQMLHSFSAILFNNVVTRRSTSDVG